MTTPKASKQKGRAARAKQIRELADWLSNLAESLEGGWPEPNGVSKILDAHNHLMSDEAVPREALIKMIERAAKLARKEHADRTTGKYWVEAAWLVVDECCCEELDAKLTKRLGDNVRLLARAIHAAAHPGGRGKHAVVSKDDALRDLCRAVGLPWVERDSAKRTKRRKRAERPSR